MTRDQKIEMGAALWRAYYDAEPGSAWELLCRRAWVSWVLKVDHGTKMVAIFVATTFEVP